MSRPYQLLSCLVSLLILSGSAFSQDQEKEQPRGEYWVDWIEFLQDSVHQQPVHNAIKRLVNDNGFALTSFTMFGDDTAMTFNFSHKRPSEDEREDAEQFGQIMSKMGKWAIYMGTRCGGDANMRLAQSVDYIKIRMKMGSTEELNETLRGLVLYGTTKYGASPQVKTIAADDSKGTLFVWSSDESKGWILSLVAFRDLKSSQDRVTFNIYAKQSACE